ncbi:MAG: hypothetical protein WC777_00460 [Candidatus Gracilibacteria bacterium]|jgi:hypothetical protein
MDTQRILELNPESFVLLVRQLRRFHDDADLFEVDLDNMRVKGDLRVIQNSFDKPIIGRTRTLDMAKRAAKASLPFVKIPKDLELDAEFTTLVKNKGTTLLYI